MYCGVFYHILLYFSLLHCFYFLPCIVFYCIDFLLYCINCIVLFIMLCMFLFIVFIRSSPDIRWKCYNNTANSRTKRENIEIYENRMLSVIKVGIEPTKLTNRERKSLKNTKHNEILI